MARLPTPGSDDDTWGNVLNDFLAVAHNTDGSLKNNAVTTTSVTDTAITEAKLALAVQTKLNAGAPDATTLAKGVVQLAGDLGGTAAAPTVPGLAGKANTSHTHTLANVTDVTATVTELNYVDGVTSAIQTQLNGKQVAGSYAASSHTHVKANITDFAHAHVPADITGVTATVAEINFIDGVTSAIQTQLNAIPVAVDQRHFRTTAVSGTSVSWDTLTAEGLHTNLMLGTQPQGPGGGYYYVQTYTYNSSNVTQVGIPYISTDCIVYRNRYNSVWSSWVYVPRGAAPYTTGTNADGTYYKYPDGRLECKNEITISISSTTVTYNWTYPHAFITDPVPMAIARSTVPQNISVAVTDSANLLTIARFHLYRSTSSNTTFTLSAYGRWY